MTKKSSKMPSHYPTTSEIKRMADLAAELRRARKEAAELAESERRLEDRLADTRKDRMDAEREASTIEEQILLEARAEVMP